MIGGVLSRLPALVLWKLTDGEIGQNKTWMESLGSNVKVRIPIPGKLLGLNLIQIPLQGSTALDVIFLRAPGCVRVCSSTDNLQDVAGYIVDIP